jgi:DinB superfamily
MTSVPIRVLLQDLFDRNEQCIMMLQQLEAKPENVLTHKASGPSWSALECIDHLVQHLATDLPKIKNALVQENVWSSYDTVYKASLIGDFLANGLLPNTQGQIVKKRAVFSKKPKQNLNALENLESLKLGLAQIKDICETADKFNFNKKVIALTLMPWLKINIGDKLRAIVYHNERHLRQALAACGTA